ncbi:MAG: adenylyl-sulfate kinase [Algicola sp.]|nr:adenylyl-sulfate kinase [Algicola sp.]
MKESPAVTENVVWHQHKVDKTQRQQQNGHQSAILWFTGLSGSGKSTIADALEQSLHQRGIKTYLLDGDNVRHGLCGDLGFSDNDRQENIRRVGEVAKLMSDAGQITLSAFISPFRKERQDVRDLVADGEFIEVFVDTPFEVCAKRDPKGLYAKALRGEIKNFTGIDSDYEAPQNPQIHLHTDQQSVEQSVEKITTYLANKGIING